MPMLMMIQFGVHELVPRRTMSVERAATRTDRDEGHSAVFITRVQQAPSGVGVEAQASARSRLADS